MTRKMKDSGVEWIGEIPEDWDSVSLSRVLKSSITDGPHETPEYVDDGIPFISVDSLGFGEKANLDIVKRYITQEDYELFNKKTNLVTGDILFTKAATIGKLAIKDDRKYMVWSPIAVIKPNDQIIESEFLYNVFSSNKYISHVILLGTSNTQINVGMGTLEKSKIPVPPKPQQKSIADFLDEKTQEIDNIISKTKKAIEEYKKYKQSLITETVTKGLDENVEMKDSGIEWIGEIPEHWGVRKLKTFIKTISKGTTPSDMNNRKTDKYCIRYLKAENINNGISKTPINYISKETNESLKRSKLEIDDILFIIAGATIGRVAVVDSDVVPSNINQAISFIRLNDDFKKEVKLFRYILKSDIVKEVIRLFSVTSAQPNLSMTNLGNIEFPFSSIIDERNQIIEFLDKKTNQIDQIISTKEKLLTEMEAYKKSLIYETVTGKREVE